MGLREQRWSERVVKEVAYEQVEGTKDSYFGFYSLESGSGERGEVSAVAGCEHSLARRRDSGAA